jgi:3-dehydroshikimate dehydratase
VDAAVFRVTNTNSEGAGSLRQAILDSNATPEADSIEFAIPGAGPHVIQPEGQWLPPIKGPAVIRVRALAGGEPSVVLDGSRLVAPRAPDQCPGATATYNAQTAQWETTRIMGTGPNVRGYFGAGLAVHDSRDVDISGLEVRNFCVGIAVVRSSNVAIHDLRIVDSHGAAGVIFTGDDGQAGSTPLAFNNRLSNSVLLDNGDGFEFTRGARDSVLEGNRIALTRALPVDGNAVEFATAGDHNSVIGNTFTGYVSTAMTVGSGSRHVIRGNHLTANAGAALTVGGADTQISENTFSDNGGTAVSIGGSGHQVIGNVVSGNRGVGVQVTGQRITVSKNTIVGNAGLPIDLTPLGANVHDGAAACAAGTPDCDTGANGSQNAPIIDARSTWTSQGLIVQGVLESGANLTFTIEVFASRTAASGLSSASPAGVGRAQARGQVPGDGRGPAGDVATQAGGPVRGGGGGRGSVDPGTATATATPTGEGEKYLGSIVVKTDTAGKAEFRLALAATDPFGQTHTRLFVSGTATDSDGNTSELGPSRAVVRQ